MKLMAILIYIHFFLFLSKLSANLWNTNKESIYGHKELLIQILEIVIFGPFSKLIFHL